MSKLLSVLIVLGILMGVEVAADDPILGFYDWATVQLNDMGAQERARQQDIQTVACEAQAISPCPTVPPWIPMGMDIGTQKVNP